MSNEFDYKKYLQLVNKRKRLFALVALAIMTGAVIISYLLPKKYEARSTVFIEKNVISELVKGIAVTPSMEDTVKVLTYAINSRTLLTKVINDLDLNVKKQSDAQFEETIKDLQKNTVIKLKDKEGLFIISFVDENPRFARDYVNALVRRYIEENVSSKREESYGATSFLSDQIATFKAKLDKAEADVNNFKREKGAVIAVSEGSIQPEISAGQQRLDDIMVRRSQLESLRSQLKKSDPARDRLRALQKRLDELRVEYTENYPEVLKVKADIESAKEEINRRQRGANLAVSDPQELEKVEAELRAVKSSEENQRRLLASNRVLQREAPTAKAALEKLEQEKNNRKTIYEQLVARHGQAEVSKQMEVQDKSTIFRIVDPAVTPVKPISPDRVKIILLGIFAGLAGGLGVLMLFDYLDHSVKSVDPLKRLGMPILAVIPKITTPEELLQRKKIDMRTYKIAGVYFSLILTVLAVEAIGISCIDNVFENIKSLPYLENVKDWFR